MARKNGKTIEEKRANALELCEKFDYAMMHRNAIENATTEDEISRILAEARRDEEDFERYLVQEEKRKEKEGKRNVWRF